MKSARPARSHFFLPAPKIGLDGEQVLAFERLFQSAIYAGMGSLIDYTVPHPKYEFLYYLVRYKQMLLHGSTQPGVEVFKPLRLSNRMNPSSNLITVCAAADEISPIFSAVKLDDDLTISGFFWATDDQGMMNKFYDFSLNAAAQHPTRWTTGMVYLLPRASFEPWGYEWVSKGVVRPLLALPVVPEDFPFLADIQNHDARRLAAEKRAGEMYFFTRPGGPDPLAPNRPLLNLT